MIPPFLNTSNLKNALKINTKGGISVACLFFFFFFVELTRRREEKELALVHITLC
ncbi:uncharacterized protein BDW43DRAFT_265980 [Aspergillus alliaceus]|uniref:uncharacterized protein n=1 Tax=Petromyces alliaceus TaxID=209559 RepID=UPI0012A3D816|nr:uncharacterized protein BDW43DRAFT_265980 [Aspergillus alliaceus]KAB8236775.1 hypothetical protein BDW43DRAFT_265980 [Aspergillus alliaceus]